MRPLPRVCLAMDCTLTGWWAGQLSGADWKVSTWQRFEKTWCAAFQLINFYLKCFGHLNLRGCRQQMGRWGRRERRVNMNAGAPSAATKAQ